MRIPASIPLTDGPCQSATILAVRRMHPGTFYGADFQFSSGQHIANVPLYVSVEETEQVAREVAATVAKAAANSGRLDIYDLIRSGTLPFAQLLLARAEVRRDELAARLGVAAVDLPYIISLAERNQGSSGHVCTAQILFAHSEEVVGTVSLSLPPGGDVESLERWLREVARQRLGETQEASSLKTHARTPHDGDVRIAFIPRRESLYASQDGLWRVEMFFDDAPRISLALRTRDAALAEARADALWERMNTLLHEQGHFTRNELADYLVTVRELLPDAAEQPERLQRSHLGPMTLRYPDEPGGCKVYLKWTGRRLRAMTTSLHGGNADDWGKASFALPPDASYTASEMAAIKGNLWAFIQARLSQAFADGYRFQLVVMGPQGQVAEGPLPQAFQPQVHGLALTNDHNLADLEITLTPGATIGFTPRGWERFTLDVLQGRIDTDYVRNAFESGFANPFDPAIPEDTVRLLRRGPILPRAAVQPEVTIRSIQRGGPDVDPAGPPPFGG